MDLNAIKQKLDGLQQKTTTGPKKDYSLIFWRPTVGKQQIRIVPSKHNANNPFTELKFYYGITNKVMLSPLNFGEKDPIESTGTPYNKSSVRVRLKSTPLSEEAAKVEQWAEDQPDPTAEFKRFTFDEMKVALEKWLSPEEVESDNVTSNAFPTQQASTPSTSNFSLDTSNVKKTKNDEFDSLFDDKKGDEPDDLPF